MLSRASFDNDAVAWRAANPSSFGYHHGPFPSTNQRPATANNDDDQPQPPASLVISKVNTGVCDVDIDGSGSMCGTPFRDQPSLRRHLRVAHPGAAQNPTKLNVTIDEKLQGENALKRWVLTGGWRNATYVREPGRGPEGGLLELYADACERIAREDDEFNKKFGQFFHRRVVQQNPHFRPYGTRSQAKPRRQPRLAGAEAPAAQSPPPPAGPIRSARSVPSQGRAGGPRGGRAKEVIVISDDEDEDEDTKVKVEPYTP